MYYTVDIESMYVWVSVLLRCGFLHHDDDIISLTAHGAFGDSSLICGAVSGGLSLQKRPLR